MFRGSLLLSLVALLPLAAATAQDGRDSTHICLAPARVESTVGNSDEAVAAVRESFTSYLTGPSLAVTSLSARLESQARDEAKAANCPYLLLVAIEHVRKTGGGGLLKRMAGTAVQEGAYQVGASASSTAGRVAGNVAARAAGAAANDYATSVRTKDEMTLTYRLESASGSAVASASEKRKAKSDGEDLLTPLVEHAAEAIATAVAKGHH